jgi:hypothetical protein
LESALIKAKNRGDNHWETLRSIRHIAKESGDLARIVQWVNDAGSGYLDTADNTLAALVDERDTLRSELERCRVESEIHKRDVARYRRIRGGRCVQIGDGLRGEAVDAVVDDDLEKIPNVYPVDAARAAHSTSETRRAEDSAPPSTCRERLRAEGKMYPRSSCEACGKWAPKWKECSAALKDSAPRAEGGEQ